MTRPKLGRVVHPADAHVLPVTSKYLSSWCSAQVRGFPRTRPSVGRVVQPVDAHVLPVTLKYPSSLCPAHVRGFPRTRPNVGRAVHPAHAPPPSSNREFDQWQFVGKGWVWPSSTQQHKVER